MRIGVSLQSHDVTWGGPGVATTEILRHLLALDRDNEYVLMYPSFGGARRGLGQYGAHPNVTEVTDQRWRVPISECWEQIAVPRLAKRYRIDLFFGPCMSVPIAGRYTKVMMVPGIEYYTVPEAFDLNTRLRWRFMHRFVLRAADQIMSISDTMTEDFHRLSGYPRERMRKVSLAASERFAPITDPARLADVRRRYGLDEPYLLFVGRLFPSKNLSTLLRAFGKLRNRIPHRLLVIGRPRWKYGEDLLLIDRLGLASRVQRLDFVPGDDLPALYSMAECFIYPSLYESFGIAQLEAMACGCPVIGARAGSIPEISGGAALLVEPRDADGFAAAIERVVGDAGLRQSLVRRGLARAKEFTWARSAAQVLDILNDLGASRLAPVA